MREQTKSYKCKVCGFTMKVHGTFPGVRITPFLGVWMRRCFRYTVLFRRQRDLISLYSF